MSRMTGVSVVVCCAFCSQTVAGPDWNEGGSDAGPTVGTQRTVSRMGGGAMGSIGGSTSAGILVPDPVDLIEIYIADPAAFVFSLSFIAQQWDNRLFLFRGEGHGTDNPLGEPLLMSDNIADDFGYVTYTAGLGNAGGGITNALSSIGESFLPGRYLIAICGNTSAPRTTAFPYSPIFSTPFVEYGTRINSTTAWSWNLPTTTTSGGWGWYASGVVALPPDNCIDAQVVTGSGSYPIDNTLALPIAGQAGPCVPLSRDVWYRLHLDCGQTIRVSTCNTVNFDSVIVVYSGECANLVQVACNDDFSGCGLTSYVEFCSNQCGTGEYLVRVGSYSSGGGGSGSIEFECIGEPASPDLNGDGVVNGADLTILLSGWTGG